MVVTYHGKGCVKASVGSLSFGFNPPSKKSKLKFSGFGADVSLVSINDPDYNGGDRLSHGERIPFVIEGPGEYEVQEIFIKGVPIKGADDKINTAYVLKLDDIRLCHLGAPANAELTPETFEALGEIDVLFIPTYNEETLSAGEAQKLATRLGAKVVVPLFLDGDKDTLKDFLKEAGEEDVKPVDKWTVKRKDIEDMEGEVVVIKS